MADDPEHIVTYREDDEYAVRFFDPEPVLEYRNIVVPTKIVEEHWVLTQRIEHWEYPDIGSICEVEDAEPCENAPVKWVQASEFDNDNNDTWMTVCSWHTPDAIKRRSWLKTLRQKALKR